MRNVDDSLLQAAKAAPIVTFGSPSAVKSWVALAGLEVAAAQVRLQQRGRTLILQQVVVDGVGLVFEAR